MSKISAYYLLILLFCLQASSVFAQKWTNLFNGKNLNKWEVKIAKHPYQHNFLETFQVKDNYLTVDYSKYDNFNEQYGHLFYSKPYSYYVLEIEYRFIGTQLEGGPGWAYKNSGLMLHSQDPKTMLIDQDFPISIEAQFLGGDATGNRSNSNVCTPGTTIEINNKLITAHCIESKSKTYRGENWVKAQIIVLGDQLIEHVLDQEVVLSYKNPKIGGGNVLNYDPKIKIDGQPLKSGYIAIQSESHPIQFKTIRLLNLEKHKNNPQKLESVLKTIYPNFILSK